MGTADILRASAERMRRDGWWGNGGEPDRRTARCTFLAVEDVAHHDRETCDRAFEILAAYLGILPENLDDVGDVIIDWNDRQPDCAHVAGQLEKAAAWWEEVGG